MKVLIPVDGSQACCNATRFVCEHRDDLESPVSVYLVHVAKALATEVTEEIEQYGPLSELSHEKLQAYYRAQSDEVFASVEALLTKAAISYQKIYEQGDVVAKIQQVVENEKIDLIVMGTRGQTSFESLLFGSVMTGVIASTTVPTLVVSQRYDGKATESVKVAVAMDTFEEVTKPLAYVLSHRNAFAPTTQYQLIHVQSNDDSLSLTKPVGVGLELDQLKFNSELQEKGLLAQAFDLRGEPGITLTDHCREEKVGLIVMGSHGYGRIRSALMGSMVRRVASLSPIPLLIVR